LVPCDDPSCATFNAARLASREAAAALERHVAESLVVEPGKVSVEVYRSKDREDDSTTLAIVTAAHLPWEFSGYAGSTAKAEVVPRGIAGPRLFSLELTQCPGGVCGAGCSPDRHGVSILFQAVAGRVSAVPWGGETTRGAIGDADRDGKADFQVTFPFTSWGRCDGAWCCWVNTGPGLAHYVAWDGAEWSDSLPQLRKLYRRDDEALSAELAKLRNGDRSDPSIRCSLAKNGSERYWLGQLLGEARGALRQQWDKDLAGFTPADCVPAAQDDEPDPRGELLTAAEFRRAVLSLQLCPLRTL
jgi:hypothetical protein